MIARQSKKQQGISLAAIALMMVLAQSNLIDVYADHMMWIAAAIPSTALGTTIAFAGTRYSLTIWWQLTFLTLTQFIIGPVIALPSTTIAHVIPSLDTLSQGWEMTFGAFKYLISVAPPVGTAYGSLMAVWTIGLWLAFLAGTFAISDHAWTSAIAAIPLATAMAVCALLGTSHGWHRTLCGITFAVLLIIWMAWRLELMEWERWFCALVVVTLAAGLAVGGSALASPHRLILRDTYNPPLSPYDYTSPLSSMRSYIKDHRDDTLLTITNLPAGTPVRLAVMDWFDGSVWNLSDSSKASDCANYQRVGTTISTDERGMAFTATFTVHRGLADVWLPLAGAATGVQFLGKDENSPFYYNRDTNSAILPSGTSEGLTYIESGIIADTPTDQQISTAKAANISQPKALDVPNAVSTLASAAAGGQSRGGAAAQDLAAMLRSSGWFSHGLQNDYPSAAGHGNYRVNTLLTGTTMVGDSEQYASAMALMARELGLPSRVVLGFLPKDEDGDITNTRGKKTSGSGTEITFTGDDITAWVEIKLRNLGWVAFYPTPKESKTPDDSQSSAPPDPKNLVRQPPVPFIDPLRDQTQVRGQSALSGTDAEVASSDESFWLQFHRASRTAAIYGSPLWITLTVCVLILAFKALMIALAQRRGSPRTRIAAGWNALRILAVQSGGIPLSGTRRNQAHAIAHQFGIANQALQQLGREADYATFSGRNITPAQSTQYWTSVKRLRTAMLRSMPRLKRLRTQLSLRGVIVRIPRQSRSPSRAEILKTGSAGHIHRTSSVSRPSRASRDNRHQYKSQNTRPADPSRK